MTNFNYSLALEDYTWENAILWGNFKGHCKKANEGTFGHRVVHVLIAAVELLPIIGQIASIFETIIIRNFGNHAEQQMDPPLSNNVSNDGEVGKIIPSEMKVQGFVGSALVENKLDHLDQSDA